MHRISEVNIVKLINFIDMCLMRLFPIHCIQTFKFSCCFYHFCFRSFLIQLFSRSFTRSRSLTQNLSDPNVTPRYYLTHWGRVTHICVSKLIIIGFSEILNVIETFSFKKIHLKLSSGKWQLFCRRHFEVHFLNEKVCFSTEISLKIVPVVLIDNIPALV